MAEDACGDGDNTSHSCNTNDTSNGESDGSPLTRTTFWVSIS
jgi:hypothetical protein